MNEGILGSPFHLVFNGTNSPELIKFTTPEIMTGSWYDFKLYSMNKAHLSVITTCSYQVGIVPQKPMPVEHVQSI